MTKKRLLFFTNSLYGGGAEKVLQTLLSNLDSSKYDITLYSVNEETLNERYPSNLKFRYIFKQNATNAISRFWVKIINKIKLIVYYNLSPKWFYRLFVKGKYDTEIAFIEGYSTRIISGSTNKSSNKVAWVHIDLLNNHWTNIAYQNKIEEEISYYKYNNIICVSENVEESMLKLFPKLKKVQVKYNPIDDKSIRKFSTENCTYYNYLNLDTIKLVSTGRLVHQKGYDRLLPIIKRLVDDGHNIHLTILGEG
jgi:glycosyltransferase involved in cell wall biosynthesis